MVSDIARCAVFSLLILLFCMTTGTALFFCFLLATWSTFPYNVFAIVFLLALWVFATKALYEFQSEIQELE